MTRTDLPPPDARGWIRFPDGAMLFPSHSLPGFWHVKRADGTLVTNGEHHRVSFPTLEDAIEALIEESPVAV